MRLAGGLARSQRCQDALGLLQPPCVKAVIGEIRGYKLPPLLDRGELLCVLRFPLAHAPPNQLSIFVYLAPRFPLHTSETLSSRLFPITVNRFPIATEEKFKGGTQRNHQTHGTESIRFATRHYSRERSDRVVKACCMHFLEAGIKTGRK